MNLVHAMLRTVCSKRLAALAETTAVAGRPAASSKRGGARGNGQSPRHGRHRSGIGRWWRDQQGGRDEALPDEPIAQPVASPGQRPPTVPTGQPS